MTHRSEGGSAAPLILAVLILGALGVTHVLAVVADYVNEGARAQTAADASALAAVQGRSTDAGKVAAVNGAQLVSLRMVDGDAIVTVVIGSHEAQARARSGSSLRLAR